ncbi:MAG: DegV family protein [Anaerolineae bacterium]
MGKVAVVTDSMACIPAELVEAYGIHIIPIYVVFGQKVFRSAIMGSMLQIKPIISVEGGRAEVLDRPRTKAKAVRRVLEIMERRVGLNPVHVAVLHGDALEEAERLRDEVASRFDCVELLITEFSPVLGAHAGPGVLGMAFWAEE